MSNFDFEKMADEVLEAQYKTPEFHPRTTREKMRALSEEFQATRPILPKQEAEVEEND